ncbi:MAG: response regulator [Nitrospiraceae bacterium]
MEGRPHRQRILVVNENEESRLGVCERLAQMGFEAVSEGSGLSCLSRLAGDEQSSISGVLLELEMSTVAGLAILKRMRHEYPRIPVIMMSDAVHIDALREAVKLGAQEYVVRPFDTELLRRKCLRIFSERDHRTYGS